MLTQVLKTQEKRPRTLWWVYYNSITIVLEPSKKVHPKGHHTYSSKPFLDPQTPAIPLLLALHGEVSSLI